MRTRRTFAHRAQKPLTRRRAALHRDPGTAPRRGWLALLVASAIGAAAAIGGIAAPAAAAPGPHPVCSTGYVYSVASGGDLNEVNATTTPPTITTLGSWPRTSNVNGVGIGANGDVVYALDRTGRSDLNTAQVLKYTPATATWQTVGFPYSTGLSGDLVAGAVDLRTGNYLFGGFADGRFYLYQFNTTTSGFSTLGYFDTGLTGSGNGDMAFDAAGNLYVVASSSGTVAIFTITAANLASANGGRIPAGKTTTVPTSAGAVNGIAFDADGTIYLGTTSTLYHYNPTTWALLGTTTRNLSSSTDLASCNSPATLAVQKDVQGRAAASDQFTMTLASGSTTVATATTSGGATGIQPDQVGPVPVVTGSTYGFSEAMATGSASSLASYTTTWRCVSGGSVVASGTGTSGSVTVPRPAASAPSPAIVCTFTNSPLSATVAVSKTWVVRDARGTTLGTYRLPGDEAALPAGLNATPTIAGAPTTWGTPTSGYVAGQSVAIAENAAVDASRLPGCALTSSLLTTANGAPVSPGSALPYSATLTTGANAYTITNTVTCTQRLTLVKRVAFGDAAPTAWTLTATGPQGALPGPSGVTGSAGATASVSSGTAYTLTESGGPAGYVPTSAGWACVDSAGAPVAVSGSAVTVPLGQLVTCTITNTTAVVTVLKHVEGDGIAPSDFTLSLTPQDGSAPGHSGIPGSESPTASNTFAVTPGATYTLAETSGSVTLPYLGVVLQTSSDGTNWNDVSGAEITVPAGTHVYYRFVNSPVPALMLPLTGGTGIDVFWLSGGIVLALGVAAALAWQFARRRRRGEPRHP